MRPYDIYIFFLCFIVFTALTLLFSYLIYEIIKLTVKVIKHGVDDEKIIKAYEKEKNTVSNKIYSKIFSLVLCGLLIVFFGFSLWLHLSEDVFTHSVGEYIRTGVNEYAAPYLVVPIIVMRESS